MTALITVLNSDGVVGQCNAKCYDARSDHCECICGGMNHGAGLELATESTNRSFFAERAVREWAEKNGLDAAGLVCSVQSDAFPYGNEPTTAELKAEQRRTRLRATRERNARHCLEKGAPHAPGE